VPSGGGWCVDRGRFGRCWRGFDASGLHGFGCRIDGSGFQGFWGCHFRFCLLGRDHANGFDGRGGGFRHIGYLTVTNTAA
jgi:hypothetical protein